MSIALRTSDEKGEGRGKGGGREEGYIQLHYVCVCLADDIVAEKFLSYNRANRAVAILCNHQRAVPKTFEQQMTNLQAKVCIVCVCVV